MGNFSLRDQAAPAAPAPGRPRPGPWPEVRPTGARTLMASEALASILSRTSALQQCPAKSPPGRVAASAPVTVPLAPGSRPQLPATGHTVTGRDRSGEPGAASHQHFSTLRPGRQRKARRRRAWRVLVGERDDMLTTHLEPLRWSVAKAAERPQPRFTMAPGARTPYAPNRNQASASRAMSPVDRRRRSRRVQRLVHKGLGPRRRGSAG
jgi:hypothetical protein